MKKLIFALMVFLALGAPSCCNQFSCPGNGNPGGGGQLP